MSRKKIYAESSVPAEKGCLRVVSRSGGLGRGSEG